MFQSLMFLMTFLQLLMLMLLMYFLYIHIDDIHVLALVNATTNDFEVVLDHTQPDIYVDNAIIDILVADAHACADFHDVFINVPTDSILDFFYVHVHVHDDIYSYTYSCSF